MTASSLSDSNSADRDRRQEGLDLQRHCRGDLGHDLLSQCTKFERHFDARLGAFGRGRLATGIHSPCMTQQGRLCQVADFVAVGCTSTETGRTLSNTAKCKA